MFRNNSLAEMVGKASSVKVLMTVVRHHTLTTSFATRIYSYFRHLAVTKPQAKVLTSETSFAIVTSKTQ